VIGAFALAYAVWRFAEIPAYRWLKARMTAIAQAIGWPLTSRPAVSKMAAF